MGSANLAIDKPSPAETQSVNLKKIQILENFSFSTRYVWYPQ